MTYPHGASTWIIPARAGFTSDPSCPPRDSADHPRSRGVYASSALWVVLMTGSSPLARGLRGRRGPGAQGHRIIPARAGFTPISPSPVCDARDHPRSRGVYVYPAVCFVLRPGSSPLARGLQDLPRARERERGGSSPLARGLLLPTHLHACLLRIIPARAGFTELNMNPYAIDGDHPRSRGVYYRFLPRPGAVHGSSPLARGLQDREGADHAAPGIIPARAGFTF